MSEDILAAIPMAIEKNLSPWSWLVAYEPNEVIAKYGLDWTESTKEEFLRKHKDARKIWDCQKCHSFEMHIQTDHEKGGYIECDNRKNLKYILLAIFDRNM